MKFNHFAFYIFFNSEPYFFIFKKIVCYFYFNALKQICYKNTAILLSKFKL